jgi:hypothetical protein
MTGGEPAGETIQRLWSSFCDDLKAVGPVLGRPGTPDDEVTAAEGVRHLTRLLRMGLEASVEAQGPLFPALLRLVDETKKFGCDNPDTMYLSAELDGARRYRITGTRGSVDYLSFTTQQVQGTISVQTGFLDSAGLTGGEGGNVEIILSEEPSAGNWLRVTQATNRLSVRQTFGDRGAERPADLRIECIDAAGTPPALTVDALRDRLAQSVAFVRYCATTFTDWTEGYRSHPNALPPADQARCLAAGGDPNIYFYRSYWELDEGQALIVHIPRIPPCDTWNLQVDNYWQESMDYRFFRSRINARTAVAAGDGSVTAVIAHGDPGIPNWLQTAGHRLGHFAMRYVRAAEVVDPVTRVCAVGEVAEAAAELRRAR